MTIARKKEDLPKLKEGYARLVHFTKAPLDRVDSIRREGLRHRSFLSSTANIYSREEDVKYASGDDRFSGPGTTAVIMDLPFEEANLHDWRGRGSQKRDLEGIVPPKYLVGIIDVSSELPPRRYSVLLGIISIAFFVSFILTQLKLTGFVFSNLKDVSYGPTVTIPLFLLAAFFYFLYLKYKK